MTKHKHDIRNLHPTEDELAKIFEFMESLGLHGVLMVGRSCPDCGALHDVTTASDLLDIEEVESMMRDYLTMDVSRHATVFSKSAGRN